MLRQTRPWVLLFAILGFIGCGLMVLAGVLMALIGSAGAMDSGRYTGFVLAPIYALGALLYFFMSLYLYRYGSRCGRFVADPRTIHLDAALEAQKSYWKLLGFLTVIMLVGYALILLVAFALGLAGGMR